MASNRSDQSTPVTCQQRQQQQLPVPVEAVVQLGYPVDLVLSTYRRLLSNSSPHLGTASSQDTTSREDPHGPITVSAEVLLTAVDASLGSVQDRVGWDSTSERTESSSASAESAASMSDSPATETSDRVEARSRSGTATGTSVNVTAEGRTESTADRSESAASPRSESTSETSTPAVPGRLVPSTVTSPLLMPGRSELVMVTSGSATAGRSEPKSSTAASPAEGDGGHSASERARNREQQLQRLRALRAENRALRQRQNCKKCGRKPPTTTLLPCGHFLFCEKCASTMDECAFCQRSVYGEVRTFLA